ncbi:MAG: acyloxyacyl hydrolase [Balneolaceae bacterium]|nr:acyloxyacyl hydrolase [Balneolaceae bacterium]
MAQQTAGQAAAGKRVDIIGITLKKVPAGEPGIHEFQVWGGYSFFSSNGVWGKTPDSQLGIMGLRYNRKWFRLENNTLEYSLDFNLFAKYVYPEYTRTRERTSLSGVGLAPAGFQFNFNSDKTLQPFLKASGGFLYLSRPFPDDRGIQFNFTLELGGGLEYVMSRHSSFTFGYKYHHMSNGEIGVINPGVDSNMFYVGVTIF